MTTLTVKLPDDLALRLQVAAERAALNKSELLRQVLRNYLDDTVAQTGPSALDLLGDLAGVGEGPGDLSTNKEYLSDMGR